MITAQDILLQYFSHLITNERPNPFLLSPQKIVTLIIALWLIEACIKANGFVYQGTEQDNLGPSLLSNLRFFATIPLPQHKLHTLPFPPSGMKDVCISKVKTLPRQTKTHQVDLNLHQESAREAIHLYNLTKNIYIHAN